MESITVLYDLAAEIGVPNEKITINFVSGNLISVDTPAGSYFAKMNKAGTHIRKNTLRRDFN